LSYRYSTSAGEIRRTFRNPRRWFASIEQTAATAASFACHATDRPCQTQLANQHQACFSPEHALFSVGCPLQATRPTSCAGTGSRSPPRVLVHGSPHQSGKHSLSFFRRRKTSALQHNTTQAAVLYHTLTVLLIISVKAKANRSNNIHDDENSSDPTRRDLLRQRHGIAGHCIRSDLQ